MKTHRCVRILGTLLLNLTVGCSGTDAPFSGTDTGDDNGALDMGTTPNNGDNNDDNSNGDSDTGSTTDAGNSGSDTGVDPNNSNNDPDCPTPGEMMCDGVCMDTTADPENCGGCGVQCGASTVCMNSMCMCSGANDCNSDIGAPGGDGCECAGTCDGTMCMAGGACDYDVAGSCTSDGEWCANGACSPCEAGKKNCDLRGTCECEGDCNGTMCTSMACTYDEQGACNSDDSMWCSSIAQNTCVSCTTGFFNCNNTAGCECDSAGCNGQECAGQCFGGECP